MRIITNYTRNWLDCITERCDWLWDKTSGKKMHIGIGNKCYCNEYMHWGRLPQMTDTRKSHKMNWRYIIWHFFVFRLLLLPLLLSFVTGYRVHSYNWIISIVSFMLAFLGEIDAMHVQFFSLFVTKTKFIPNRRGKKKCRSHGTTFKNDIFVVFGIFEFLFFAHSTVDTHTHIHLQSTFYIHIFILL